MLTIGGHAGSHAGSPSQSLRALPGCGAGAADEDVEHLAAGWAKAGKLGQVEAVWQPHRAPAAPEEGTKALRGALPGTVRIEDAVDGQRLGERWQSFVWKVRAADRKSRQSPADGSEQIERALDEVGDAATRHVLQAHERLFARQTQVFGPWSPRW